MNRIGTAAVVVIGALCQAGPSGQQPAGDPTIAAIKDFKNYDTRTRHTNADFADAVSDDDLKQLATVLAAMAWRAATRDEKIPRRPRGSQ